MRKPEYAQNETMILNSECMNAPTVAAFLEARYNQLKAHGEYSYRDFSRRAGFGSPNYLKLVATGARNMSPEALPKFIKGLLIPADAAYVLRDLYLQEVHLRATGDAA